MDYFKTTQTSLKPHMRKIVIDWMLEVCEDQQCQLEIFFLSVDYLDAFLSIVSISKQQFQLVATSCLLLASKVWGSPISAALLAEYTDNCFMVQEIVSWELLILTRLDWNININNCITIVKRIIKDFDLSLSHFEKNVITLLVTLHEDLHFATMTKEKLALGALSWVVETSRADVDKTWKESIDFQTRIDKDELRRIHTKISNYVDKNFDSVDTCSASVFVQIKPYCVVDPVQKMIDVSSQNLHPIVA